MSAARRSRTRATAAALACLSVLAGCGGHHRTPAPDRGPLALASPAFAPAATIPAAYSCKGADTPPPLTWHGSAPTGTVAWAIVLEDLDVTPGPWVQWVVSDIPFSTRALSGEAVPDGAVVSEASNTTIGYVGLCPPSGRVHRYRFTVYAQRARLGLRPHLSPARSVAAISTTALSSAALIGSFAR
jgi:hypothetical protein